MKPNTRILDYTTLIQDGVLTLDDVPQDIAKEVTKWVRYLSGVTDNGMVKDNAPVSTSEPTPTNVAAPTNVPAPTDTPINGELSSKGGE